MDRKELIDKLVAQLEEWDCQCAPIAISPYLIVWQERPYTAVDIALPWEGHIYQSYGWAKVQYPDRWDADYGRQLAIRKACAAIAKQIMNGE